MDLLFSVVHVQLLQDEKRETSNGLVNRKENESKLLLLLP